MLRLPVQVLTQATAEQRRRLLELFPHAALRDFFGMTGSKEGIAATLAKNTDPPSLKKIALFCDANFALCKQHIYIFSHDGEAELGKTFSGAQRIVKASNHSLYLIKRHFKVVLLDPPENGSIDFLWPIRVELRDSHLIVRFVVLEKAIPAYFEREIVVRSKSPTEETMLKELLADGTLSSCDLNKGIKALWAKDFLDATHLKYDLPDSSDTKHMHEGKGLKKTNIEAYNDVRKRPLRMCTFEGHGVHGNVGHFSVNPTDGFIGFTRYAKEGSNGDQLIEQILQGN